jgi:spore coat polysaccharide biosynthesis protein SpsF (cytidylyltransferase family)
VLDRYARAARFFELHRVVRATGDNPAVDIDAVSRTLALLDRTSAAHIVEHGLPYGAAVEAVSAAALVRAAACATDPADREHVTTFIRRDPQFVALTAIAPREVRRPDVRLTVDTLEDLERMRLLYAMLGRVSPPPPLADLIAASDRAQRQSRSRTPEAGTR